MDHQTGQEEAHEHGRFQLDAVLLVRAYPGEAEKEEHDTDWLGLAKAIEEEALSQTSDVVGTLWYTSTPCRRQTSGVSRGTGRGRP